MHEHGEHRRHGPAVGVRSRQRRWGPWWEEWGAEWGPPMRGPGRRARRGDIRTAVLGVLAEGPAHGYEIINRLEDKSGGAWRPSPGSIYPTLQLFEDEGLVRSQERDGKRVYDLTEAGRAEAAERAERFGAAPWDAAGHEGPGRHEAFRGLRKAGEQLRPVIAPLMMAIKQVGMTNDPEKFERALSALNKATKELYQILSE